MASIIPLLNGTPYQSFSVALGQNTLEFKISWVNRFSFFRVNIRDLSDNGTILINGNSANLEVNLLRDFPDYGSVFMRGNEPTIENIGVSSNLYWEPPANG